MRIPPSEQALGRPSGMPSKGPGRPWPRAEKQLDGLGLGMPLRDALEKVWDALERPWGHLRCPEGSGEALGNPGEALEDLGSKRP